MTYKLAYIFVTPNIQLVLWRNCAAFISYFYSWRLNNQPMIRINILLQFKIDSIFFFKYPLSYENLIEVAAEKKIQHRNIDGNLKRYWTWETLGFIHFACCFLKFNVDTFDNILADIMWLYFIVGVNLYNR